MSLRAVLTAATLALAAFAATAQGEEIKQDARAVLELFTSQGCSSCPKADALLKELASQPDIIALAYHVDYWDYVGWPDTFGSKEHSDRQRDYAAARGSSRIFTPQLVVNGSNSVVASRRNEVSGAVTGAALQLPVKIDSRDGMLEISIPGDPKLGGAVVWLVSFLDHADVKIDRGENQGKTIAYTQIVIGRQAVGMWEPGTGAHLKLPLSEVLTAPANGAVVLVQQEQTGLPGPILGAASFVH